MSENAVSLAAAVTRLAEPLAASLNLEVWGVEALPGPRTVVRVYVEGENGATIDDCARLSRLLSLSLDVEDSIPGAYVLEVSSPGLERIFFHAGQLVRAVGDLVEVVLHDPVPEFPGCKRLRGIVRDARDAVFILEAADPANPSSPARALSLVLDAVKRVRRVHETPMKVLPGKAKKAKTQAGSGGKNKGSTDYKDLDDAAPM